MKGPSLFSFLILFSMSFPAFALEDMDDAALGELVAQDGATWSMDISQSMDALRIVDKDGFAGALNPGQVLIKGLGVQTCLNAAGCTPTAGGTGLVAVFNAGAHAAGTNPLLSVGLTLAGKIRQHMTGLWIGNVDPGSPSMQPTVGGQYQILKINPLATNDALGDAQRYVDIVTSGQLRIDFGNQPSGHLISTNNFQIESITVNGGLALCDASSVNCANALSIGSLTVTGSGVGNNIDLSGSGMGVNADGLYLTMGPNVRMDVVQTDIGLGAVSNPKIGNMVLRGLDISGATVTLRGH